MSSNSKNKECIYKESLYVNDSFIVLFSFVVSHTCLRQELMQMLSRLETRFRDRLMARDRVSVIQSSISVLHIQSNWMMGYVSRQQETPLKTKVSLSFRNLSANVIRLCLEGQTSRLTPHCELRLNILS